MLIGGWRGLHYHFFTTESRLCCLDTLVNMFSKPKQNSYMIELELGCQWQPWFAKFIFMKKLVMLLQNLLIHCPHMKKPDQI